MKHWAIMGPFYSFVKKGRTLKSTMLSFPAWRLNVEPRSKPPSLIIVGDEYLKQRKLWHIRSRTVVTVWVLQTLLQRFMQHFARVENFHKDVNKSRSSTKRRAQTDNSRICLPSKWMGSGVFLLLLCYSVIFSSAETFWTLRFPSCYHFYVRYESCRSGLSARWRSSCLQHQQWRTRTEKSSRDASSVENQPPDQRELSTGSSLKEPSGLSTTSVVLLDGDDQLGTLFRPFW